MKFKWSSVVEGKVNTSSSDYIEVQIEMPVNYFQITQYQSHT